MKKIIRIAKSFSCICILFVFCIQLVSCGDGENPADIFSHYLEIYGDIPCGVLYDTSKKEREEGYFTDRMKSDLYAREDGTSEMEHVREAVVFLGSSQNDFYELGIFICNSHREAEQVAKMCFRRIDTARTIRSAILDERHSLGSLDDAFVTVKGKICIYSAMPDNEKSRKAVESII